MDKLYIGDIPLDYHYASMGDNHIDLYNTNVLQPNTTYTFYRIFMNYNNQFLYLPVSVRTGNTTQYLSSDLDVTNDIMYRRDMPSIMCMTFIFVIGFVFLINIVTSYIKKGGLFGGLF